MAAVQLLQLGPGNLDQRSGEKNLKFGCVSACVTFVSSNASFLHFKNTNLLLILEPGHIYKIGCKF